jgi:hypothetical protein
MCYTAPALLISHSRGHCVFGQTARLRATMRLIAMCIAVLRGPMMTPLMEIGKLSSTSGALAPTSSLRRANALLTVL